MLINLELQNEGNDTDLKRMIYYCSRMLSSEKNRIFSKDEYKDIIKVGALWICVKNKKELENAINVYSIQESNIEGNYKASIENYDLMEIVTLYLGSKLTGGELDPFNILFKSNLKPNEIFNVLEEQYDIHFHTNTKEEVQSMCDLGQGIYKEALQKGIEQGEFRTLLNLIIKKMKKGFTAIDALIDLDVDENQYDKYLKEINKLLNDNSITLN